MLVRTDVPLANQLVQAAHACLLAGEHFPQPLQPCSLVLLAVSSQSDLLAAVEAIEYQGVKVLAFYEPDFPQGYTAACTEPIRGDRRRIFRKFRLWR